MSLVVNGTVVVFGCGTTMAFNGIRTVLPVVADLKTTNWKLKPETRCDLPHEEVDGHDMGHRHCDSQETVHWSRLCRAICLAHDPKFMTLLRKQLTIFITRLSAATQQPARSIGFSCKIHYGCRVSHNSCRLHSLTLIWTTLKRRDSEV